VLFSPKKTKYKKLIANKKRNYETWNERNELNNLINEEEILYK